MAADDKVVVADMERFVDAALVNRLDERNDVRVVERQDSV
jgi:hypothetical protein